MMCVLCDQPIEPATENDAWKQVVGFVGGPKKDSMRLREDTGSFAHDDCIERIMNGQAPDQEEISFE